MNKSISMKAIIYLATILTLLNSCKSDVRLDDINEVENLIEKASAQLHNSPSLSEDTQGANTRIIPRSLKPSGELRLVKPKDWTSGFYPGVLWLMYDLSRDTTWKAYATAFTLLLEDEKNNARDHDIGFKMMSSYGHAYRLTGNKHYREVLIQSAKTLTTRYNNKVGCIRSWDHHKDKWQFPVIIDNMMNLELLFFAWKETNDSLFYNVANEHAQTTLKNHFRKDYSSYHVVSYDTISGDVMEKNTHQGFAHESSWARGQAWALYGYTMMYRETKNTVYLDQAENIADYIINTAQFPDDYIPYWDYHAPNITDEPKDASSAAIMASAFYELSSFSMNNGELYIRTADRIMTSLSSEKYLCKQGSNKGFLLAHSTGSKPKNSEVDVPLVYADYYFLEALKRKGNLLENN